MTKKFIEMDKVEVVAIIRRGGDKERNLETSIREWLDSLSLTDKAEELIAETDPKSILETFYLCKNADDVECVVADILNGEF